MPPEKWGILMEKDQKDPRYNYEEVLRKAKPEIKKELTEEVFRKKYRACQEALAKLRETFSRLSPDTVVIIGDDQHEQFWEDNMPMFSVYYGDTVEQKDQSARRSQTWWNAAYGHEGDRTFPCDSALARHLIKEVTSSGFDLSTSSKLRAETGIGHAFTFVTNHIIANDRVPIVPLMVNAFFPPNQPLPKRCYALGKALGDAIRSWGTNRRVAIVASGGLSHFIIDEEIDKMALDGLLNQDRERLSSLPRERLMVLGTGEILNWIMAAGALELLCPKLLDYVPCYRTPAGTGCAMGFMQWI
jgi:hypothetical protein